MAERALQQRLRRIVQEPRKLLHRPNRKQSDGNRIYHRYRFPLLTADHALLAWRYDFNHATNPHLMTRLGIP